mmetsp:Transcript_29623/g.53628  ORF Transcript_29623/g.53628 Transcript_29623/m.53628 type:complete len:80 (-) Transcript_29623:202-441(-)
MSRDQLLAQIGVLPGLKLVGGSAEVSWTRKSQSHRQLSVWDPAGLDENGGRRGRRGGHSDLAVGAVQVLQQHEQLAPVV